MHYSPWDHKELDMTEWLTINTHTHTHTHTPLQGNSSLKLLDLNCGVRLEMGREVNSVSSVNLERNSYQAVNSMKVENTHLFYSPISPVPEHGQAWRSLTNIREITNLTSHQTYQN